MKRNSVKGSSIVCGLLFLAAGVLLFAFNTNPPLLDEKYKWIFSWQMLPISLGFVFLFSRGKWIAGIILMLVGGFFIMPKLNIEGYVFVPQFGWALGLIIVGILIICNTVWRKQIEVKWCGYIDKSSHKNNWKSQGWKSHKSKSGHIERNCVFYGTKEKWDMKNFSGGEINSVFGNIELDMSEVQLAEGVNYLELNAVFGGIVIYVPIEWNIEIRKTNAFGAFVDNRPKPVFEIDDNRTLIIEANAVFGGGEIRCK